MAALGQLVTVSASRTDTAGITLGSSAVTDTSITAADAGRAVTGTGIPAGCVVGNVTASTGFNLYKPSDNGMVAVATATNASVTITLGAVLLFQVFDGIVWQTMQATSATYPLLPQYFLGGDVNAPLPVLLMLPSASTIYLGGSNVTSSSTHIGCLTTGLTSLAYNCVGDDSLFAVIASSTAAVNILTLRQ